MDEVDLDAAAEAGRLQDLFAHEIGHVLGIGTSGHWAAFLFEAQPGDLRLRDVLSTTAWARLGGTFLPPVHVEGGAGTAGAHWRESDLDLELMTPSLDAAIAGGERPLSLLTLGYLASFGYSLDLADAEPYTLPSPLPASRRPNETDTHFDRAFGPGVR